MDGVTTDIEGARARAEAFCRRFGLRVPVLEAPMAGACPPELAVAVIEAGGMGASGVVLDPPEAIAAWVERVRAAADGPFQLNIWLPDPPVDDAAGEAARAFLGRFGTPAAGDRPAPDFTEQCEAMLAARPAVISSIMGLFPPDYVRRLHDAGIAWFATVTTLAEGLAAQEAGADVVVAQGVEAGGHRGTFDAAAAATVGVGLLALVPQLADRLDVPVVATGGIADGRAVAAALTLGASAVQVGTALLRAPEAGISAGWAQTLATLRPEDSVLTRAYSGRTGRAVPTAYVRAWQADDAPPPAPHPLQRRLVGRWRRGGAEGIDPVNHWAGQAAALGRAEPAGEIVTRLWREAEALLPA
jgi:nitronate monooxygenase